MTDPPILEVEGLAAGYGAAPIVSGISLRVGRGEIVSILGPNGAGKSTLLKALVGVIRALQGTVRLDGQTVTNLSADTLARLGLGYVPQVNDIFDALSVAENLEMGGYLLGKREFAARRTEVLAMLPGLRPMLGRNAGKLSGGERKLLAVGRVLMPRPKILILDEPTGSEAPISSAAPTGGVEGLVGSPGVTPPPTDTFAAPASIADQGWRVALVLIASLLIGAAP